ncbi:hypothetical protein ACFWA5_21575 [Streptomyces mirabilis]|uniref:hypothetical protein n=1 Tax=Streptomyces mirabilis TaxID=68239 RepID=UPI0036626C8D
MYNRIIYAVGRLPKAAPAGSHGRRGRILPAMPEWFSSVWPVATFFLGGASAYLRDFVTEKRQIARDSKARQAERDKVISERRETFELDHLERLNEALQKLGRAAGRAHHVDMMTSRQTGHYAGTRLSSEDSDAFAQANRDVHMLRNLVLDDALRNQVARVHEALNVPSSMHRSDPDDAEQQFAVAILALDAAQAAIAARIREIYLTASLPAART